MGDEASEAVKSSVDLGSRSTAAEIVTRSEEGKEKEEPSTAAPAASVSGASESTNGNSGHSDPEPKVVGSNKSPSSVGELKGKDLEDDRSSWVIDIKSSGGGDDGGVVGGGGGKLDENFDGERVCRICHLCSDPSQSPPRTTNAAHLPVTATAGLIQLGCDCKDELGIVHAECAEAWFKLKGNRQCEICGECAKNITGVVDNRFIEEWNDATSASSGTNMGGGGGRGGEGCWRGQPFCNFVMACLVIAFVVPWFFRVNFF